MATLRLPSSSSPGVDCDCGGDTAEVSNGEMETSSKSLTSSIPHSTATSSMNVLVMEYPLELSCSESILSLSLFEKKVRWNRHFDISRLVIVMVICDCRFIVNDDLIGGFI